MARYFFHVTTNGDLSSDDTGVEFASDAAAEWEAIKTISQMAERFAVPAPRPSKLTIDVRDGSGAGLCTVTLEFSLTH